MKVSIHMKEARAEQLQRHHVEIESLARECGGDVVRTLVVSPARRCRTMPSVMSSTLRSTPRFFSCSKLFL